MQQTIPYSSGRTGIPPTAASDAVVHVTANDRPSLDEPSTSSSSSDGGSGGGGEGMRRLVAENPVVVVGRRGCCMCHVVKRLLFGLGVNPAVCEVAEDAEAAMVEELAEIAGGGGRAGGVQQQLLFPAVFIGGRLVGGLDRLMAVHISGDLVPSLKEAGALWL